MTNIFLNKKAMQGQNNIIFAFVGTAATGKTYLAKHLSKKFGFSYIPSVTSRPKRHNHESDYKHVSRRRFIQLVKEGEMLEYVKFNGQYYGKLKHDVEHFVKHNHCVYTLTFDRITDLKRHFPNTAVICLMNDEEDYEVTTRRILERGGSRNDVTRKLKGMKKDFKRLEEAKSHNEIDYFLYSIEELTKTRLEKLVKEHLEEKIR